MFLFFTFCLIVWGKRNNDRYKQSTNGLRYWFLFYLIKLSARFTSVLSVYINNNFQSVQRFDEKKELSKFNFEFSHANLEFVFFGRYKLLISFLAISWLEFIIRFVLSLSLSLCQFFSISPLLVDYARRTKLFFSSIRRDYRLQRKRCVIRPEGGGGGKKPATSRKFNA